MISVPSLVQNLLVPTYPRLRLVWRLVVKSQKTESTYLPKVAFEPF